MFERAVLSSGISEVRNLDFSHEKYLNEREEQTVRGISDKTNGLLSKLQRVLKRF